LLPRSTFIYGAQGATQLIFNVPRLLYGLSRPPSPDRLKPGLQHRPAMRMGLTQAFFRAKRMPAQPQRVRFG
jgi:hypothetical protein